MTYGAITTRITKLERQFNDHIHIDATVFLQEYPDGMFDVYMPSRSGIVQHMTPLQVEARPPHYTYLFLMADGGIYMEEAE